MSANTTPKTRPSRPTSRHGFEIAIICALPLEADAVYELFDVRWDESHDDGPPFDKAPGDPNTYSTGAIGRHNVVLAHMPGMGKVYAAIVAAHCQTSFPNIKLALVYDLGRQLPDRFVTKNTLPSRPNLEIQGVLAKLKLHRIRKLLGENMANYLSTLQQRSDLEAEYLGKDYDRLFEATYCHVGDKSCEQLGCNGKLVPRQRLQTAQDKPEPVVHFGLIASGDTVMKSGEDRDRIAQEHDIIAFEMESAGVWDSFPCLVIKGACYYADSHKSKAWQRYAAATAAVCMKAFLNHWVPSLPGGISALVQEESSSPRFFIPYPRNEAFVGRQRILEKLQQRLLSSVARVALFGLGGIGKTQICLAYAYWLHATHPEVPVFWVHATSANRFRESYKSIAEECRIAGYKDPQVDVLALVKKWLERELKDQWLMIIDNANDKRVFDSPQDEKNASPPIHDRGLAHFIPECSHGSILITTRNKQVGVMLTKGGSMVEVGAMDKHESGQLVRTKLDGLDVTADEASLLSDRLEHLPLALTQAAAYIQRNSMTVSRYLQLLNKSDHSFLELLSKEFETVGRDSGTPHAVAATWIVSFEQIKEQNTLAVELLSLMCFFDRQAIPVKFLSNYYEQHWLRQNGEREIENWQEEIRIEEALGTLKAFSFISADNSDNLALHRLVQLVTRKWLVSKGLNDHFARLAFFVVSNLYPDGKFETRAICGAYLPHVSAVLNCKGASSSSETTANEEMRARASLFHRTSAFFSLQGRWEDAERHQLQAVEIRKQVLGEKHPATLTSMCNLASVYCQQGRWKKAEVLGLQLIEIEERVLGEEYLNTLTSMNNLVSVYDKQGRWKEAEVLGLQVIEIRKRVLREEHPDILASMNNLAYVWQHQGRFEEAIGLMERCLQLQQRNLGPSHRLTAGSHLTLKKWKKAKEQSIGPSASPMAETQSVLSKPKVARNGWWSECRVM